MAISNVFVDFIKILYSFCMVFFGNLAEDICR